ncbi:MAG: histidine--tRNA ligase [Alphaproteobacteria bacterium]
MNKIQSVRGTRDLIGDDVAKMNRLIDSAKGFAQTYNYQEIITPIIESAKVFTESLGQDSDIIHKEMFLFDDRGGDKICLRPENTAAVVRALVENGWQQHLPCKFFYHGAMFRYERPQKGRYRQFYQFGVEYLHRLSDTADGIEYSAMVDVDVISLAAIFLGSLNIGNVRCEINSLGNQASRKKYRSALVEYFETYENDLSFDSKLRLKKNPLRILDSKDEGDKKLIIGAPKFSDYYDRESKIYFDKLQELLAMETIPFVHNEKLVRGLDYYCHTAFEFVSDNVGAQGTILAGGRYDGLPAMFGEKDIGGVGFAAGLDRMMDLLPLDAKKTLPLIFLCPIGRKVRPEAISLAEKLRQHGLRVDMPMFISDNIKKILSFANKSKANIAIIFGDEELANKQYQWKNLESGEQKTLSIDNIIDEAKKMTR